MKKFVDKKNILFFILGIILTTGFVVVADKLSADEISFKSRIEGWTAKTVREAMDDLYNSKGTVDT